MSQSTSQKHFHITKRIWVLCPCVKGEKNLAAQPDRQQHVCLMLQTSVRRLQLISYGICTMMNPWTNQKSQAYNMAKSILRPASLFQFGRCPLKTSHTDMFQSHHAIWYSGKDFSKCCNECVCLVSCKYAMHIFLIGLTHPASLHEWSGAQLSATGH